MKKIIRIGGLALFWISSFVLVATLLRWKQKAAANQVQIEENGEINASASMSMSGGGDGPGSSSSGATSDKSGSEGGDQDRDTGPNNPQHDALFEIPKPFSYEEVNMLMMDLHDKRTEYEQKLAALSERERNLETQQEELDRIQTELMVRAQELGSMVSSLPSPEADDQGNVDPDSIEKLAKLYDQMSDNVDFVAQTLEKMPRQRAVLLLKAMDEEMSAKVLQRFSETELEEIISLMLESGSP